MFDSKQTLTERIADAVDLIIDFATLGEYGMEPSERAIASCESRRRPAPSSAARPRTNTRGQGVAIRGL